MTFRKVCVRHARVCMTKISNEFPSKLIKFTFFHTNVCNFQENSDNNIVENIFLRVVFIAQHHEENVANILPCGWVSSLSRTLNSIWFAYQQLYSLTIVQMHWVLIVSTSIMLPALIQVAFWKPCKNNHHKSNENRTEPIKFNSPK